MANKKIEESKKILDDKVEEIVDENVKLEKDEKSNTEVEELKEKNAEYEKQLEEMKIMMENMKSAIQNMSQSNLITTVSEQEVEIGTYMIQGIGLTSTDGTISISIPYNFSQSLSLAEVKNLLRKQGIRELFEDGVCYFTKPEDYKVVGVTKKIDLSDENLVRLASARNTQASIREFNIMTSNFKNSTVTNCIIYRICNLIANGKLSEMDYRSRKDLEDYFGIPFERGIQILSQLNR